MCNCGNKRDSFTAQSSASTTAPAASVHAGPIKKQTEKMWPDISFVYTGQSALSATGNVTGKRYRFSAPGEKQQVDYRDAPSMMTVPVLKRID